MPYLASMFQYFTPLWYLMNMKIICMQFIYKFSAMIYERLLCVEDHFQKGIISVKLITESLVVYVCREEFSREVSQTCFFFRDILQLPRSKSLKTS